MKSDLVYYGLIIGTIVVLRCDSRFDYLAPIVGFCLLVAYHWPDLKKLRF